MNAQIKHILSHILEHCDPCTVILYGEKHALATGEIKSLDFCIILPEVDKPSLTHKLYLAIESDIPFQVLLYSCREWQTLIQDATSYATAIRKKGTVLYGQEP